MNLIEKIRIKKKIHKLYEQIILCRDIETEKELSTAEDVAKVADIDLTDKNFWRAALQTIADQIDLLCALLEE